MPENTAGFQVIAWFRFRSKVPEMHKKFLTWANTEGQKGYLEAL